ncbi:hypothetical protein [Cycloclasticus sp.]|nr:hypothetical protein [Cycloclasticus sp.]
MTVFNDWMNGGIHARDSDWQVGGDTDDDIRSSIDGAGKHYGHDG